MLVCGCGRWMHTEGVDERLDAEGNESWFVRWECLGCGLRVGLEGDPTVVGSLVDRMLWTDDAKHLLDRMPPYVQQLRADEVAEYARSTSRHVVTLEVFRRARLRDIVSWEPRAQERLLNIPAPVREMAKIELERTAAEKGHSRVTIELMDEVKARYFGLAEKS